MIQRSIFLLVITVTTLANSKQVNNLNLCNNYNNTNKIVCFCSYDSKNPDDVKSADCYLADPNVGESDPEWKTFEAVEDVEKIVFSNSKEIPFTYIPTNAIKIVKKTLRIDVKFGNIKIIKPYAFANLSEVEEIVLSDNQIQSLRKHAFANHKSLTTINLDTNDIIEINRDVFHDLPSLDRLFLTMNKISTIHDKAFKDLNSMKELELDKNKIFSLNSETFSGLTNLLRLELSRNSLEVIGDNTFKPLTNLQYLNLEGNKIQMLDAKAFNGLSKVQHLSLALNKMNTIKEVGVFGGLKSLSSLSLRGNKLKDFNFKVLEPILTHFFYSSGTLDFEENNFPCNCNLDWLLFLKNKTSNEALKLGIENLKCTPSAKLNEEWQKIVESENKNDGLTEDGKAKVPNEEYEYYDDTQLEGQLFYLDIRDLLNCTKNIPQGKLISRGVLDLSRGENKVSQNIEDKKFTTSRLATVSANPIEKHNNADSDMASDEAVPDKVDRYRSNQDIPDKDPHLPSGTIRSYASLLLLITSLPVLRLVI